MRDLSSLILIPTSAETTCRCFIKDVWLMKATVPNDENRHYINEIQMIFFNRFVKYRFHFASVEQTGSCQVSENILRGLPCCLLLRIHQLQSRKCVIIRQMFPRVDTELSLQVSYLRSTCWDGEALRPVTKTLIAHWFDPLIGLMHWQPGWVDRGGHKPL